MLMQEKTTSNRIGLLKLMLDANSRIDEARLIPEIVGRLNRIEEVAQNK